MNYYMFVEIISFIIVAMSIVITLLDCVPIRKWELIMWQLMTILWIIYSLND